MKNRVKIIGLVLLAWGCKKPFTPPGDISADNRYLVVEGVISMNDSTFIRLSRTKKVDTFKTVVPELHAQVNIESNANASYALIEAGNGIYAAPPLNLDTSRRYRLRIKTTDGKEYISDFVPVKDAPPIDSIGFIARAQGVQLYVNSHNSASTTRYYRWEYQETWQFHSMYASSYRNDLHPRLVSDQKYSCFASDTSGNILLASTIKLATDVIYQAPLTLIPANSEKIETKYSILVRQYALTSDAYDFWQNLQKNTENIGSIFDVLPSEVQGNFHCLSNPSETVIGYLCAGNITSKRIFISADELLPTYSVQYPYSCVLDTTFTAPADASQQRSTNIYWQSTAIDSIVQGLYGVPDVLGVPYAYTYSAGPCVDCTIRGTRIKPSFWK
ncbi:MAG TPA: DUF4249 domain-containing protein [Mucilaginibacter sp.]|nr:DUF4249 domain-containing protein [Mucilaginibacter sp.]